MQTINVFTYAVRLADAETVDVELPSNDTCDSYDITVIASGDAVCSVSLGGTASLPAGTENTGTAAATGQFDVTSSNVLKLTVRTLSFVSAVSADPLASGFCTVVIQGNRFDRTLENMLQKVLQLQN